MGEWYTTVRQPTCPWTGPMQMCMGCLTFFWEGHQVFHIAFTSLDVDDINVKGGETVDEGRREKKVLSGEISEVRVERF